MLRLVLAVACLAAGTARAAEDPYPWIAAAYVVKRDGALLWAGSADRRLAPASLAKMMTALIALERGGLDEPVAVGRGVLQATGTRIGLKPGERLTAGDLLAATVVRSANDACRALADHIGGKIFVQTMNARAVALGLANTRFADPCGHDRDGQYTSAADLARLAEQLMRHEEYLRLARIERMSIRALDGGRRFALRNTNALLGRYPGAIGLKTGYTKGAGNCLVALAERDGVRVLAVLLNAPNRWWNAVGLLDRAFAAPGAMKPALAVAAVAAAAYLPSLAGVFHFDDYNVIVHYPTVHSWEALLERAGGGVRPLLKASYTLNWTLGSGFSFFNIAVHALNAALLFLIGDQLFRDRRAALVAALLFALHPAATEAVTYISGRSSSLMALFYLGALLAYLRGAHWFFSALLFLLAVATRETAVTLPAALLLCELCRGERPAWREILRRQWAHWALLLAGGLFLLLNQRYFDLVAFGYGERSLADNLLTQVGGVSYLVLRLVSLHGYNIDPALPTLTEWTPALAAQAFLLATLFMIGIANLRARPWIGFGVLWFFLQLVPTNSIVPRLDVANDRQLYLACWGLFIALSLQLRNFPRPATAVLLALFAITSISRQLDYRSEIALWESSVRLAPWNARGHNNLGYAYQLAGHAEAARREYRAALLFDPRHAKARLNLMFLRGA